MQVTREYNDQLCAMYGDLPRVKSAARTDRTWAYCRDIDASWDGKVPVLLRGRVHTVRGKGKSCFLVLRQSTATIQLVMFSNDETVSKPMVKYASQITRESIVEVEGTVVVPEMRIEGCTQKDAEIHVTRIQVSRICMYTSHRIDRSMRMNTSVLYSCMHV